MKHTERPEHGGRVTLRRSNVAAEASNSRVIYDAEWATEGGIWRGRVVASTEAAPELELGDTAPETEGDAPPRWLTDWTVQLVRTTARSVASTPDGEWPRRLTRWRAAPEER